MFSMSGKPASIPGSRVERSGEEETEIARNFSKPANTPLKKTFLRILIVVYCDQHGDVHHHLPGEFGQVLLTNCKVFQVGQGKQLDGFIMMVG